MKKQIIIFLILFLIILGAYIIYEFIIVDNTRSLKDDKINMTTCITKDPNNLLQYYEKQDGFIYGKDIILFRKNTVNNKGSATPYKENFVLPSTVISDPNMLDPNKSYIIYNRRTSNLKTNSTNYPINLPGYTCPEFPDFLYKQI